MGARAIGVAAIREAAFNRCRAGSHGVRAGRDAGLGSGQVQKRHVQG